MATVPHVLDALSPAEPVGRAPVVLVAAANESQGARHLRSLSAEVRDVVAALQDAQLAGVCEVVTPPDATPEQVMRVFQSDAHRDRIAILHFAGHAGLRLPERCTPPAPSKAAVTP